MASKFTFDFTGFKSDLEQLEQGMKVAGKHAIRAVVEKAAEDATYIIHWRTPGMWELDYPSGNWQWEVTGLAHQSIFGYVVPDRDSPDIGNTVTTSYWNGIALNHPHYTDDSVTEDYSEDPKRIIGVVTMNINYAPYLQDFEMSNGEEPVTVEVLSMNWDAAYVPGIVVPILDQEMSRFAS